MLQERVDAVDNILNSPSHTLDKLQVAIRRLPDLVKGLARVQYGKVCMGVAHVKMACSTILRDSPTWQSTPQELAVILEAYDKIGNTFKPFESVESVGVPSPLLCEIAFSLPKIHEPIKELLDIIIIGKAHLGEKENLWRDEAERYPLITAAKEVTIPLNWNG